MTHKAATTITAEEKARREGIRAACLAARLTPATAEKFIEQDTPLVEAQHQIFDVLAKRNDLIRHLPSDFLERVSVLLRERRTGQVNINVHQGRIVKTEIRERQKASESRSSETAVE